MFILETNFDQIKVITMMKNYDQSVEINYNPNWSYITDHPNRICIIGGWVSGKTNVLLNLTKNQQPDSDNSCLSIKVPFTLKYQLLINRREN